jgi:hypothetical protein
MLDDVSYKTVPVLTKESVISVAHTLYAEVLYDSPGEKSLTHKERRKRGGGR